MNSTSDAAVPVHVGHYMWLALCFIMIPEVHSGVRFGLPCLCHQLLGLVVCLDASVWISDLSDVRYVAGGFSYKANTLELLGVAQQREHSLTE